MRPPASTAPPRPASTIASVPTTDEPQTPTPAAAAAHAHAHTVPSIPRRPPRRGSRSFSPNPASRLRPHARPVPRTGSSLPPRRFPSPPIADAPAPTIDAPPTPPSSTSSPSPAASQTDADAGTEAELNAGGDADTGAEMEASTNTNTEVESDDDLQGTYKPQPTTLDGLYWGLLHEYMEDLLASEATTAGMEWSVQFRVSLYIAKRCRLR